MKKTFIITENNKIILSSNNEEEIDKKIIEFKKVGRDVKKKEKITS